MLKEVLETLFKTFILRLLMTLTPAMIAFGSGCLRSLLTGMSGAHGEEGRDMEAPLTASEEEQAQPAGLLQVACAPSSSDAMPGMGIQERRTQYFLLLEIDGLLIWQFFGQVGPLRVSLELTV